MPRYNLIARMCRFAPLETGLAVLSGLAAICGVHGFYDYIHSGVVSQEFTPLIYSFGPWPFYALLLVTVASALAAYIKADKF